MDRDGRTAQVISWTDDEDDDGAAPAFDPAAVLRAIAAEDEETPAVPVTARRTDKDGDFEAALRAALAYASEIDVPDEAPEAAPVHAAAGDEDEDYREDDAYDAYREDDEDAAFEDEDYLGEVDEDEAEAYLADEAADDAYIEDEAYSEDEDEAADEAIAAHEMDAETLAAEAAWDAEEWDPDDWTGRAAPDAAPADDEPADEEADDFDDLDDDAMQGTWDPSARSDGVSDHHMEHEARHAPAALRGLPRMDELDLPGRKPRIALMGEFSAGKSTLSNLLIGSAPLPMKVTATQLPPVWISWGEGQPYREDIDGETHPIDIARLSDIDPAETRVIRIFAKSEVLEACDIIDMPGISDPNMASEVWERVIGRADAVIWCTHATQAWRQTEASVWESLDPKLFARSLLLITRFDKLLTDSDRSRVLRRVERETEGLFADRLPISLTRALAAGDDPDLLQSSGAADFREKFLEILDRLAGEIGSDPRQARTQETLARDGLVTPLGAQRHDAGAATGRILPRRVRPISQAAPSRR